MNKREIAEILLSVTDKHEADAISMAIADMESFKIGEHNFTFVDRNEEGVPSAVYKLDDDTYIMWVSISGDSWDTEDIYADPQSWLDFYVVTPSTKTIDIWVDKKGNRVGALNEW